MVNISKCLTGTNMAKAIEQTARKHFGKLYLRIKNENLYSDNLFLIVGTPPTKDKTGNVTLHEDKVDVCMGYSSISTPPEYLPQCVKIAEALEKITEKEWTVNINDLPTPKPTYIPLHEAMGRK